MLLHDFTLQYETHQDYVNPKIESKEVEKIMGFGIHDTEHITKAIIAKYIREQEKHDQMMDKIATMELEDPFKGMTE